MRTIQNGPNSELHVRHKLTPKKAAVPRRFWSGSITRWFLICREPHTRTAPRLALYRNGTDRLFVVDTGADRPSTVLTTSSPQRCSISSTVPLRALTTALSYLPAPRPRARRAPPPDGWALEIEPEIGPEMVREMEPTRDLAGRSRGG